MTFSPLFENSFATFTFYVFCAVCFIQLLYIFFIYIRFAFYKEKDRGMYSTPISIIICCRNEEENLLNNLQAIVEQDYPSFEVILVNHMSTDNTIDVMRAFQLHYSNVRVVNVQRSSHLRMGKKFPLSIGVKAAKNDVLLLTDADCKPTSNQWLKMMVSNYANNKIEMVLGYAPMNKTKGFLNWFSRMEATYIAINYFSYALASIPYMSVGRNFSYTKELFMKNKGFKSHYSIISGDDDLFLQEVANRKNVTIEINESTWCYSDAKETWMDWMLQKRRHYKASPRYNVIKKLLLGIYNVSWLLAVVLFVTLIFNIEYNDVSVLIFGGVLIVKWIVFALNFNKLKSLSFALLFPLWEIVYMVLTSFIFINSSNTRLQQWK